LLDDETRVLSVNRSLAGTSFDFISESVQHRVHEQLHPDCDGQCRFSEMWKKAWASLRNKDSIEWELNDPTLSRLLRFNLSKSPAPANIGQDRRQRHTVLTITDVTKYRLEYETLVEQQQALIRLLMAQGLKSENSGEQYFDEDGDTGNRLMAGYLKTEQSLSRQLVRAQEKERERIAAELHDGIVQTIGAVKYRIEDGVATIARQYPQLDLSVFDDAVAGIRGMFDEVRRISNHLSPSMLEDFGVHVALDWLCGEFRAESRNLKVDYDCHIDEGETPDFIKVAIYRVAQEALNNVAKHSSATRVSASLESSDGGVKLVITDNGCGFDPGQTPRAYDGKSGLGLRSMRERVESTGGSFTLESAPQNGTVVCAQWTAEQLDLQA